MADLTLHFVAGSVSGDVTIPAAPTAVPTITAVAPPSGYAGDSITVTGTGFTGTSSVKVNGVSATYLVLNDTSLTFTVPATTTGALTVTNGVGTGTGPSFTILVVSGGLAYLAPTGAALAPIDANTGVAMVFNGTTGIMGGTTVITTEPTWVTTVALTDTGNPGTNWSNLQNAINTAASTATNNTKITYPAGMVCQGAAPLAFPANRTGFKIGVVPASSAAFPTLSTGTTYGTKTNRVNATHLSAMLEIRAPGANQNTARCDAGYVKGYWVRGMYFTNPSHVTCSGAMTIGPTELSFGINPVSQPTTTTLVFAAGADISGMLNTMMWVHRGQGASTTATYRVTAVTGNLGATPTLTFSPGVAVGTFGSTTTILNYVGPVASPQPTASQMLPEEMTFIQCAADGGGVALSSAGGTVRAFYGYGRKIAVCDSFVQNLGELGRDSQMFAGAFGEGPFKITNNESTIGGPRENIIFGGSSLPTDTDTYLPSNIEIRGNVCHGAVGSSGKTGIEIKYGRYILIDSNYFDDTGTCSFAGMITIKLTDQGGPNPSTDTQHVMVRNNRAVNRSSGLVYVSSVEFYSGANKTRNVEVINNDGYSESIQWGIGVGQYLADVAFRYNTTVSGAIGATYPRAFYYVDSNAGGYSIGQRYEVRYNVCATPISSNFAYAGYTGYAATFYAPPNGTCYPNAISAPAAGLSDQVTADVGASGFGFTAYATDRTLTPSAPGYHAAPGSKDFGANQTLLATIMSGVV